MNRRFQTAKLMYEAVGDYVAEREELNRPLTMTGLARHLGFSSVSSLRRYETYEDQDFKAVIDWARMLVMESYEEKLSTSGASGAMFALKNMDPDAWRDKTEQVIDQRTLIAELPEQKSMLAKMKAKRQMVDINAKDAIELVPDPEEDNSWI